MSTLEVVLVSQLPLGDIVAELTLAGGGQALIVLRGGRFHGPIPTPAIHLRLTGLPAPAGEAPLAVPEEYVVPKAVSEEELSEAAIESLFEEGVPVRQGRLALELTWGLHCHRTLGTVDASGAEDGDPKPSERFVSLEHIECALLIGKDDTGRALAFGGRRAPFHAGTRFPIGGKESTFGEIIALAGDYYAHLDAAASAEFAWAWPAPTAGVARLAGEYRRPTLLEDTPAVIEDILAAARRDGDKEKSKLDAGWQLAKDSFFGRFPARRYLALASQNHCHFACQPADGTVRDEVNEALRLYRAYHNRALLQAAAAKDDADRLNQALVVDAFGCHFLTDMFAAGHLRVPRRVLGERFGVMKGAQGMAHSMHCEDNKLGLWCTTRLAEEPRRVWHAYGDAMLFKKEARVHLEMVREAVRRSAAEVFAAFCGITLPMAQRAEAILPIPLAAGRGPKPGDLLPGRGVETPAEGQPNHFPLYCWLPASQVLARRVSGPHENLYVRLVDGTDTSVTEAIVF